MLLPVGLLVMGTEVGQLITVTSVSLIANPFCLFIPERHCVQGGRCLGFQAPTEGFGQSRAGVAVCV